jgi:hypothetical protein
MKKVGPVWLLALCASGTAAWGSEATVHAPRTVIRQENERPGTTEWILTRTARGPKAPLYAPADEPYEKGWRRRKEVEAYCSHTSIRVGQRLAVYVSTDPPAQYRVDIYRMGYYGGKGARWMRSLGPLEGMAQPTPGDGPRNVRESNWREGFSLEIPQDWVSGVYLGKLSTLETGGESYVVFIVRDDRRADLVFQSSDLTWLAYDRWPGFRSLYDHGAEPWGATAKRPGNDVSFDRPYATYWNGFPAGFEPLTNGSGEFLLLEHPLSFWLEKEGYDVTYISNVDTHADGEGLLRGKVFVSVGHDEYWTAEMLANVTRARDAGVSLAFLSGNSVSGVVSLQPSTDGRPNRVVRRIGGFEAEEQLMGAKSYGVGFADWTCAKPDHWAFEGTGMKEGDRVAQLVGWEYHGPPLADHPGLEVLSGGPVYGWNGEAREGTYATTLYPWKKGNLVFNAATCWWNMVLSKPPGFMNPPRRYFLEDDPRIQRITKNILDRMIAVSPID